MPDITPAHSYRGPPTKEIAAQSATKKIIILPPQAIALKELGCLAYPEFGLFIWRNSRSFISVRCGPIGQHGNGGHAHNDQLAVEIEIDGVAWARDPGTFIYRADFVARTNTAPPWPISFPDMVERNRPTSSPTSVWRTGRRQGPFASARRASWERIKALAFPFLEALS